MNFKKGDTVRRKGKILLTGRRHKYFVLETLGHSTTYLGDVMAWDKDKAYFSVSVLQNNLEQTRMVLFEKYTYPYEKIIKRRNV